MPSGKQPDPAVRCILVIEDDPLVGETIVAMLDGHYPTTIAETVDRALMQLGVGLPATVRHGRKPDLVVLDCLLPGGGLMSILEAADQQCIPVLLISGDPDRAARIDPGRPFLPKPFTQAKLLQAVRAAIG